MRRTPPFSVRRASLRVRLFLLIVTPLVAMSVVLGIWRIGAAQKTAAELFDRSLLAAALAISRDVILSEGDAILPSTRELIRDAAGGEVFYHATGPGGIYITGYAYPPVAASADKPANPYEPRFFEALYRGEDVRVLQVSERVTIANLTGDTTVTVWHRMADRSTFVRQLVQRAAALIGGLLATVVLVVWFGVKFGLRPLTDLQQAIAIRSPDDLSRIKRAVPVETRGIVQTLNHLFGQVEHSMEAQQAFISDAAHQLRNPAAAVQSMAEAVRDAPTEEARKERTKEMILAARSSARVTNQLLSLDRLRHASPAEHGVEFEIGADVREICEELAPQALSQGIDFELNVTDAPMLVRGDQVFIREAIKNLIDNALKHGGAALRRIEVSLEEARDRVAISVADDGKGLSPEDSELAMGRFSQVTPGDGSGLGLAIVASVAQRHEGEVIIQNVEQGACVTLTLPLASDRPSGV